MLVTIFCVGRSGSFFTLNKRNWRIPEEDSECRIILPSTKSIYGNCHCVDKRMTNWRNGDVRFSVSLVLVSTVVPLCLASSFCELPNTSVPLGLGSFFPALYFILPLSPTDGIPWCQLLSQLPGFRVLPTIASCVAVFLLSSSDHRVYSRSNPQPLISWTPL